MVGWFGSADNVRAVGSVEMGRDACLWVGLGLRILRKGSVSLRNILLEPGFSRFSMVAICLGMVSVELTVFCGGVGAKNLSISPASRLPSS